MRPALIRLTNATTNQKLPMNFNIASAPTSSSNTNEKYVTVNVGETGSITLNISMQTLKEFVYELATALNLIPPSNETTDLNKSCQTSYVANPLTDVSDEEFKDCLYEKSILDEVRNNLINDLTQESDAMENDCEKTHYDCVIDIPEVVSNDMHCIIEIESDEDENRFSSPQENESELQIKFRNGHFVIESTVETETREKPNCQSKIKPQHDNCFFVNECQKKVQIDQSHLPTTSTYYAKDDLNEISYNMSGILFEYINEHCIKNNGFFVTPDENLIKLLKNLEMLYKEHCNHYDDSHKNALKAQITEVILDNMNYNSKNNLDSYGICAVPEQFDHILYILDTFFNNIENLMKNTDLEKYAEIIYREQESSTTGDIEHLEDTPDVAVNSFKSRDSPKKRSQSYWFTISNEKSATHQPRKRRYVNVDEIPLKPPSDLVSIREKSLSPIREEPVVCLRNLYDYYEEPDTIITENTVEFVREDTNVNPVRYSQESAVTFVKESENSLRNDEQCESENTNQNNEGNWMGYEAAQF